MVFSDKMELKAYLDQLAEKYNRPAFIDSDPISIPHLFSKKEDIEIAGFFAAILAWGQRKTILQKMRELLERMDRPELFPPGRRSRIRAVEGFLRRLAARLGRLT